jgi:hypothetical protein
MGAKNGIMGDENFGMDLPQSEAPKEDLTRERHMARFSQTREFKALKETMQYRMDYWRQYIPGNPNPVQYRDLSNEERGWRALVADILIEEFGNIIGAYEQAKETVAEASKPKDV